ncbi:hypothetical protein MNBD_UNCLBAC01-2012 [hydrothermal vent metagenome]|uniref:Ribbon-helix-helix protein CopG domain-containing protein n=1 Tax=hydrothermal vent metagenome TaxID=652676 RepID=A0A3B1DQ23_9ZZZZ
MSNITISVPDDLLKAGREYAKEHHTSLNALIRKTLEKTVVKSQDKTWLQECFQHMDDVQADSKGKKWTREDLYDV